MLQEANQMAENYFLQNQESEKMNLLHRLSLSKESGHDESSVLSDDALFGESSVDQLSQAEIVES